MWNGHRASMVNQMPTIAQKNDDYQSMQTTQQNSHTSVIKDKKKKYHDIMKRILEHIVNNSLNLIAFFQATTYILKNMNAHMAALVQKL